MSRAWPRLFAALGMAVLLGACGGSSQPEPAAAACGNGRVEAGEECDDGNASNTDGCLTSCFAPARFVSSDPHLHGAGCDVPPTSPAGLAGLMAAAGLEVGAALIWGDGYDDRPLFTGVDHPASSSGRILHYDLEVSAFPAGDSGHLILLGLRDVDFSSDPFRVPRSGINLPAWAKAQGERVAVGMAHGQLWTESGFPTPPVYCCIPWDFPIQASRGGVSFLVTERREEGPPIDAATFQLWRTVQNAGYRIAIMGGSDYPCINPHLANTPRTDVIVNGPLTYDGWLEGIRRGRTVVTLGRAHRLNLRVNGTPLGGEVTARADEVLQVSLESESPEPAGIEVLVNGAPVASAQVAAGTQVAMLRLSLPRSAWIVARTAHAATSAVYVVVDGRPVRGAAADICYLKQYADHLGRLVQRRRIDLGDDTDTALAAYAIAGEEFARRFAEAGGGSCP
jgi:cysteine-rich repeat protein